MNCIFCKIIKKEIPCHKLVETELSLAFLDVNPLNKGHALVIPKQHAQKLHELSDASLRDLLPIAKQIAVALGAENYNILQNNGRIAHQAVDHVHFHVIPKDPNGGLEIEWDVQEAAKQDLPQLAEQLRQKL
ncbi:adenosine 5'-monophosphoramidase [Gorgonomyces haynaldii]|nr:adenosine 5'-monophosphoramidase [Gorgonomyces haynaldii]